MWQIHLSTEDLVRVRLAPGIDPMWELMHSVQVAGSRTGEVVFGRWRRRCRRLPGVQLGVLSTLAPKVGYSPDFLTPAGGTTTLEQGVETVLGTPAPGARRRPRQARRLPSVAQLGGAAGRR